MSRCVKITYANWRGETSERVIGPAEGGLAWGCNPWRAEKQWLLPTLDVAQDEQRVFALSGIREWTPMPPGWTPDP